MVGKFSGLIINTQTKSIIIDYNYFIFSSVAGTSFEFALPGILSVMATLMSTSSTLSLDKTIKMCLYTTLAAQPSAGKRKGLAIGQAALDAVEQYNQTKPELSQQTNDTSYGQSATFNRQILPYFHLN